MFLAKFATKDINQISDLRKKIFKIEKKLEFLLATPSIPISYAF